MNTKLFPYQCVPAGFKILIDLESGDEDGVKGEIVPHSKSGIWNLCHFHTPYRYFSEKVLIM